jgi:hypothetical protein
MCWEDARADPSVTTEAGALSPMGWTRAGTRSRVRRLPPGAIRSRSPRSRARRTGIREPLDVPDRRSKRAGCRQSASHPAWPAPRWGGRRERARQQRDRGELGKAERLGIGHAVAAHKSDVGGAHRIGAPRKRESCLRCIHSSRGLTDHQHAAHTLGSLVGNARVGAIPRRS